MSKAVRFGDIAEGICRNKQFFSPTFIGAGAFKEAFLIRTPDDSPLALKIFDPAKCDLCRAEREIDAMRQCDSPYIGKLVAWGSYSFKNTNFLYIIEEYFPGGTLSNLIASSQISIAQLCTYGIALLKAISVLKENSLVHRDIKPDNIMFRSVDGGPALVDFGLVRDLREVSLTHSFAQRGPGSPFFASPEQLNNDKSLIDWRSDQFSIGVVLGICLTGEHPYKLPNQNQNQVVDRVGTRSGCCDQFSRKAKKAGCDFLIQMLSPWPIDRFSRPEMLIEKLEALKREVVG